MRNLNKCKLSPLVVDGEMIFKIIKPVTEVTIDDLFSLESLNIGRFIIRRSESVTNEEIENLENRYKRFARP